MYVTVEGTYACASSVGHDIAMFLWCMNHVWDDKDFLFHIVHERVSYTSLY
jgi:hypothetical protein